LAPRGGGQASTAIRPGWLALYIGREQAASISRCYEVQFVHGLMQTEDYARAVICIPTAHAPAEEIDRRVSLRMQRQQQLTRPGAPKLWAVLDEAGPSPPPAGPPVRRR